MERDRISNSFYTSLLATITSRVIWSLYLCSFIIPFWCFVCTCGGWRPRFRITSVLFFSCAIFYQWTCKYCFFAFCFEHWHIRWMNRHLISLGRGQTSFFWDKFRIIASVPFLRVSFCLCYFSRLFQLWPLLILPIQPSRTRCLNDLSVCSIYYS